MGFFSGLGHIFHGVAAVAPAAEAVVESINPAVGGPLIAITNGILAVEQQIEKDHAAEPGAKKGELFMQEIRNFLPMMVPMIVAQAGVSIQNPDEFEKAMLALRDGVKSFANSFKPPAPVNTPVQVTAQSVSNIPAESIAPLPKK